MYVEIKTRRQQDLNVTYVLGMIVKQEKSRTQEQEQETSCQAVKIRKLNERKVPEQKWETNHTNATIQPKHTFYKHFIKKSNMI